MLEDAGALGRIGRTYRRWTRRIYPYLVSLTLSFGGVVGYHWSVANLGWIGTLILSGVLVLLVGATVAVLMRLERRKVAQSEARLRAQFNHSQDAETGDRHAG